MSWGISPKNGFTLCGEKYLIRGQDLAVIGVSKFNIDVILSFFL